VCTKVGPPAAQVGAIAACAFCGMTLYAENGTVRRATYEDVASLSQTDRDLLKRARPRR